jgi:hypothetical protein
MATAEAYRRFAEREAAGRSPAYEALALGVAGDDRLLAWLEELPAAKRQPNLLFAAARWLLDDVPDLVALRGLVAQRSADLRAMVLGRSTQTNEPARCATLLPALARYEPPLGLVEVGASAGLCLLPDCYSYDFGGLRLDGMDPGGPLIECRVEGPCPLPLAVPEVAWRAGLDLSPLDVSSDDDVRWLACLVWPGEENRLERLRQALEVARRTPPGVVRGDLVHDLQALVAGAPEVGTMVVFHSAVLAYVTPEGRRTFIETVSGLPVRWLSNESPGVLEKTGADLSHGFALIEDGRTLLAETDPHGTWLRWLAPSA